MHTKVVLAINRLIVHKDLSQYSHYELAAGLLDKTIIDSDNIYYKIKIWLLSYKGRTVSCKGLQLTNLDLLARSQCSCQNLSRPRSDIEEMRMPVDSRTAERQSTFTEVGVLFNFSLCFFFFSFYGSSFFFSFHLIFW